MDNFRQECAALLELARELAIKHKEQVYIVVFPTGKGWANSPQEIEIGYSEPKNKALINEG